MPELADSAELMRGMLESELPPVRALLEQTQEVRVVTEAPDYRGTPTQLVEELLAELTTDELVALVLQTERPIDEAVRASLTRIRGQLRSANVPEGVLSKFDDFIFCTVSFAEVLQEEEVTQGLRESDEGTPAEHMRGLLEAELPPVRSMLEETRELHVVTIASEHRGTPTKLVDELLAELTTDELVALVRRTERPIDDAVKAKLARIRKRLRSANVPEEILAKFDDFIFRTVSFAEVLQEDEGGAKPQRYRGPPVTIGKMLADAWKAPMARTGLVVALLATLAVSGAWQAGLWFWLLAGAVIVAWGLPFVTKSRRRRRRGLQQGGHSPEAHRVARRSRRKSKKR